MTDLVGLVFEREIWAPDDVALRCSLSSPISGTRFSVRVIVDIVENDPRS